MFVLYDLVRRAFRLIGSERRWRWFLLAAMSLSLTLIELTGAGLIYLLVSLIASPTATVVIPVLGDLSDLFPGRSSRELRAGAALVVAAFFIARAVYLLILNYLQGRIVANASAVMASDLLDGYLSLPYLFHTQRNSAELIRNTMILVQKLLHGIVIPSLTILTKVLLSLTLLGTLIALSPTAMLTASALLGTTVILIQRVVRPRIISLARRSEAASKESLGAIQQSLGGIRDIKLLRRESAFAGLHRRQQLVLARNSYVSSVLTSLAPLAIETALMLSLVTVFVLATVGTAGSQAALPVLAVFAYVGLRLQPVLQEVVNYFNKINANIPTLEIIERDRDIINDWRASIDGDGPSPQSMGSVHHFSSEIALEGVSFAYLEDGPLVLKGVELRIRRGEFIGICGPTGGGKSTLSDLIIGLLQPTTGTVSVDGVPLKRHPLWWWGQIGVVSQSVFLTDDTLRNNIAFGDSQSGIDEPRLMRSVERAQLTKVLHNLSDGLDTVVGERGVRLSGGQRQRVAIARALYREPEVLVLDEGTSALDGATERALVAAIDEATHERTLIAIAHRISTIRDADRILVVADGRIQDAGTYDELLARNALFRALA